MGFVLFFYSISMLWSWTKERFFFSFRCCVYYLTSEVHADPITRSACCVCSFALVLSPFIVRQRSNASENKKRSAGRDDGIEWVSNVQPYASLNAFELHDTIFFSIYSLSALNFESLFQLAIRDLRRGDTLTDIAHCSSHLHNFFFSL